ncbi:MAG: oxidoreductase [Verrucomicrobiales bacterium]|nr:oxidoreductase [Verrucomicrobiales bacterium]
MRFQNKVAIVTGADSGIGLATAKRLGSEGAKVVLVARNPQKLEAAEKEVRAVGAPDVWAAQCDVSKEDEVKSTVEQTLKRWDGFHVLVNNAGLMIFKPIEQHTEEDWMKILHVDLLGAFFFTKQAFLHMKPGGAVVNLSSIHAIETEPQVASYAAAKAALLSFTRSTALEGKPKGIRANAILPGAIDTPMLWDNPNVRAGIEKIDKADVGKPEDVAAAVAYLASDDAAFVQGAMLRVDGGRLDRL